MTTCLDSAWDKRGRYLADRAGIVFANDSHFVDAAVAEGTVVAFGDADIGHFVVAEDAFVIHC